MSRPSLAQPPLKVWVSQQQSGQDPGQIFGPILTVQALNLTGNYYQVQRDVLHDGG